MRSRSPVSDTSPPRFSCRTNTKPKQESYEFKAPQAPPPQPPTQISPQVRTHSSALGTSPVHHSLRLISALWSPNIHSSAVPACLRAPALPRLNLVAFSSYFPAHLWPPHCRGDGVEESPLPDALSGPRPPQNTCGSVEMAPPDNIDPSAEEIWRA